MTSERLPSFTTNFLDSKSIFSSFKRRTSPAKALYEKMATFFSWQGKSADELREHGVDFVVKNTLLRSVVVISDGNERITTLRILTKKGTATLISVYQKFINILLRFIHFTKYLSTSLIISWHSNNIFFALY